MFHFCANLHIGDERHPGAARDAIHRTHGGDTPPACIFFGVVVHAKRSESNDAVHVLQLREPVPLHRMSVYMYNVSSIIWFIV